MTTRPQGLTLRIDSDGHKSFTVRLPARSAERLRGFAAGRGIPVDEAFRLALSVGVDVTKRQEAKP